MGHVEPGADIDPSVRRKLLTLQRAEITEHRIYARLARSLPPGPNRQLLETIAADELRHARLWESYTGRPAQPSRVRATLYALVARVFGLTFGLKLMERGEARAQQAYSELQPALAAVAAIEREEDEHERALLNLLDEERLRYVSSIVLGLNDALVELTGAMAGLTLALRNPRLIAMTGLITGLAAALSMASSEYLSTKAEHSDKNPLRAALYTGAAYVVTVLTLVSPYLILLANPFVSLGLTLAAALIIVAAFTFYTSVVRDDAFRPRFIEMAGLSMGVATLSFFIGYLVRALLGVDV